LILLDLNLPRMDGRTFLRRIKSAAQFENLKVVVLSGSRLGTDVREVTDMQINGYLVKPLDLNGFYQIAKDLENFLLNSKPLPMCVEW
jgi:CheY-like chemotaxis protein